MNKAFASISTLFFTLPTFAATPIDLSKQSASFLNQGFATPETTMNELSRATDFNQTLHVRTSQTFRGYKVWGSDAVVHIPHAGNSKKSYTALLNKEVSMNGIIYNNLEQDLDNTPTHVFTDAQLQTAIANAVTLFNEKTGRNADIQNQQGELIVYTDKSNKAHWAFRVSFFVPSSTDLRAEKPTFILDAIDFTVYKQWNNLQTLDTVKAGGFGGNHKTGLKIFDGLEGHGKSFTVERDAGNNLCYMQNKNLIVKNYTNKKVMTFTCNETSPEHNTIYWNANHDQVETTWSPSNDALAGAEITRRMFRDWYNMPMLINKDGTPMRLPVIVHMPDTNAYWNGESVLFGDSIANNTFNPFTQLDTVGHEICHGFTQQHSGLEYYEQSGGLNEAFSDMAGIAAEYYAYGETNFLVGWGDVKAEDKALRYMDKPSRDCDGRTPGDWCSIDTMSQYNDRINVHYSSGIFNRVFYLIATTTDWNTRKAFDVMVQANVNYWTATTSFKEAACGVIKATKDYDYDVDAVVKAFDVVGLDTVGC